MLIIWSLSFSVIILYIGIQIWQLSVIKKYQSQKKKSWIHENLPAISIWVACRNEEENLTDCIDSLLELNYPKEKIQILIGNDQSEDGTLEIAQNYAKEHSHIQVINIQDDNTGLKAKARVMAQIDKHAVGEYYLITDADVRVKPDWILGLLSNMNENTGVASGTTMVKGTGTDGWLQEIDWAYFMGLLNVISYSGVPATAVGNNMIVRKDAYWDTGGYSEIKFSITEDYKLYQKVCDVGWKWNNIMNADVLAYSEKTKGGSNLLHQRKRWLSGGKELPWYWWLLFGIYGGFYFAVPMLLIFGQANISYLFGFWGIKFILQSLQINGIYKHLDEARPSLIQHIVYEFYLFLITISTAIFFLLPLKTKCKDRAYRV